VHRTLRFALILIAVGLAGLLVSRLIAKPAASPPAEQKASHFVDSAPAHNERLGFGVNGVVVNFDFELNEKSELAVFGPDDREISSGAATVEASKTTLRRTVNPSGAAGTYIVKYRACWLDGSCDNGRYTYTVDPGLRSRYADQTGKSEVTVRMSALAFDAPHIRVSLGTTVVWVNDEDVEHFVNTDPHPSHTLFPSQNSLGLTKGGTFKTTFTAVGEYPYHCSAHVPQGMVGAVLVESSPG
jgi:plastocyanin/methionine-rich copper-binding protein CopC